MSINSAAFLLFLTVSVIVYYAVPKKARWLILLAASAFFYLSYSPRAALCLLFTAASVYLGALAQGALRKRERERSETPADKKRWQRRRRALLLLVLLLNFSMLAVFKYLSGWIARISEPLLPRPLILLMPLGISFYIFQALGYLIDCYRGRVAPERNFFKFLLFVSYFPQLVQGPINRFEKLHGQLIQGNDFNADNIRNGVWLMLWGMLKKILIADTLVTPVTDVFDNFNECGGAVILLAVVMYCIQLYCDFSGGVDLVRGASGLFGVEMEVNFCRPYFARSIDEFWRRWHMSLGEWMKNYLFYPLALSKPLNRVAKRLRRGGGRSGRLFVPCVSTFIVFVVIGIWQGPGLANIAYGLWNGALMSGAMIMEPAFAKFREKIGRADGSFAMRVFRTLRTFMLVVIGRYFSRASSLSQSFGMMRRTLFSFTAGAHPFVLGAGSWAVVAVSAGVLFTVSLMQERGVKMRERISRAHPAFQALLLILAMALVFGYFTAGFSTAAYVYENI